MTAAWGSPDTFRALLLAIREACTPSQLPRQRASINLLEDPRYADLFHQEGVPTGPMLPLFHFNALAMSRLLPPGGTLVDVGAVSGHHLSYLARGRPDIRIIGLERCDALVRVGRRTLEEEGLSPRVALQVSRMTQFSRDLPERVDAISSVLMFHRLPTIDEAARYVEELSRVRARTGCAVWIVDLVRPRHPRTAEAAARRLLPAASAMFQQDTRDAFRSAWSFTELCPLLDGAFPERVRHVCSSGVKLLQVHWLEGARGAAADTQPRWDGAPLPAWAARPVATLRRALRSVPLCGEAIKSST